MQELPPGRSSAPNDDLRAARLTCIVKLPNHRRQHMRTGEIEIVVWPVEIGRHRRNEIAAVLRAIGLAQLDSCDLRDGVRFVGRFERAVEKLFLFHWLRGVARVNARASEIQELLGAKQMRRMHHCGVDHHVVVDELGGSCRVGENTAHGAGNEIHEFRAIGAEPVINGRLVAQVELIARGRQDIRITEILQPSHNGGADQPAVTGDENPGSRHLCHSAILSALGANNCGRA